MEDHIRMEDGALVLLDQRFLPEKEEYFVCRTWQNVVEALQVMVVRGAPAIGVTAAFGCCIALQQAAGPQWREELRSSLEALRLARPTAVNLRWAVDRMAGVWERLGHADRDDLVEAWSREAGAVQREDIEINRTLGAHGAALLPDLCTVMTHCNAGALATAGYGTALGVVRAAVEMGKQVRVIANETRPFLQGARLTAWELSRDNIPVTVACDNAVGLLMSRGMVDAVIVGADRVAANGDTANKIGTSVVACMAGLHDIPFYVAAPLSTLDLHTPTGAEIPIEERPDREVTHVGTTRITPENVPVYNFAFDITPHELVRAVITEAGVLRPPYIASIAAAFVRGTRRAGE